MGIEADFETARRQVEAKRRSITDKRISLEEAVALVRDGNVVAVGGCLYSRTPIGLLWALIRRRRRNLTLVRNLTCYEAELLMVADAVDRLVTSWVGIALPWGLSRIFREYVESGRVVFEEWSHLALGLRLRAAAMGVPFLPTFSMLGSDLLKTSKAQTITCPFTGKTVCLVPALFPDVALIHVHRADPYGNAQIDGYPHMDQDLAAAAATVIVSAERVVDPEEIRRSGDRTVIPFFAVDAVVELPYGAYPHECYGLYEADFAHLETYARRASAEGEAWVRSYLEEFFHGPSSFSEYLARFGLGSLLETGRRARILVGGGIS
ncbi:MAG: CoA synthetase [Chloroflexota bacterium]